MALELIQPFNSVSVKGRPTLAASIAHVVALQLADGKGGHVEHAAKVAKIVVGKLADRRTLIAEAGAENPVAEAGVASKIGVEFAVVFGLRVEITRVDGPALGREVEAIGLIQGERGKPAVVVLRLLREEWRSGIDLSLVPGLLPAGVDLAQQADVDAAAQPYVGLRDP